VVVVEQLLTRCVRDGDCWLWTGPLDGDGYPLTRVGGKLVRVHRYLYEAERGAPLGRDVLLRAGGCRRRYCVNPAHLEARPRLALGKSRAKLTDDEARRILALAHTEATPSQIREAIDPGGLRVSLLMVTRVLRGLTFAHLGGRPCRTRAD